MTKRKHKHVKSQRRSPKRKLGSAGKGRSVERPPRSGRLVFPACEVPGTMESRRSGSSRDEG